MLPTVSTGMIAPANRSGVSLTRVEGKGGLGSESTVIEFGTAHEVLFASPLRLEFADKLRLRNSDGTLDVEACVVALQYNGSRTAVAARFTQEVANWLLKPSHPPRNPPHHHPHATNSSSLSPPP